MPFSTNQRCQSLIGRLLKRLRLAWTAFKLGLGIRRDRALHLPTDLLVDVFTFLRRRQLETCVKLVDRRFRAICHHYSSLFSYLLVYDISPSTAGLINIVSSFGKKIKW